MNLREAMLKMVYDIVEERYQHKMKAIDALNLSSVKYDEAIEQLEAECYEEEALIAFLYQSDATAVDTYLKDFFDNFYQDCLYYNGSISVEDAEKMFLAVMELVYKTKLQIFDAAKLGDPRQQISRVADIAHENAKLVTWSEAQEKASLALMQSLDKIFQSILQKLNKTPIGLFIREGRHQAESANLNIIDHPAAFMFSEYYEEFHTLFMPNSGVENSPDFAIDRGLYYLLWSALSSNYVLNSDRKNIHVFLPDGEIATSSTFWNYELNMLRKINLEAGGKINFYKLNSEGQTKIDNMEKFINSCKKDMDTQEINKKINDNFAKKLVLFDKINDMKSTLTVIEMERKFENYLSQQFQRPLNTTKLQIYLEQESNLKHALIPLEKELEKCDEENTQLNKQLTKIIDAMPNTLAQIEILKNQKVEIYKEATNWEQVPFEQLHFKGIKVRDKPFTVANLMKVGEILKKRLEERRLKKTPEAAKPPGSKIHPLKDTYVLETNKKAKSSNPKKIASPKSKKSTPP